MSPANAPRPCPYCDHVSPPDSKFCNECGAALHLQPCPHCGSVNDITKSSICGRCNGDLHLQPPDTQPADDAPAASAYQAPPPSSPAPEVEPLGAAEPTHHQHLYAPLAPHELPAQRRSPAVILVVLALIAGAGYFGYSAWQSPASTEASSSSTPAQNKWQGKAEEASPQPVLQPPSAGQATVETKLPATEVKTEPAAAAEASSAAAAPASKPETAGTPSPRVAAQAKPNPRQASKPEPAATSAAGNAATATPASSSRQRSEAQQGLDLKKPQINNCTDAVAALGLCAQETKPRSP